MFTRTTSTSPVDVEEHCYEPVDRLLDRQKAIQRTLARRHLHNGHLVLYDITSTYFEGACADSQIVLFGYNRDGKKGHEQGVIGLLCNADGQIHRRACLENGVGLDHVAMPRPETFRSAQDCHSVLFHELTHATGPRIPFKPEAALLTGFTRRRTASKERAEKRSAFRGMAQKWPREIS